MPDRIVCVPGFADNAASWQPLLDLIPAEVADLDAAEPATIAGHAALLAQRVTEPVIFIAHSIGGAIAVEAAHQLGQDCLGLLSIEGNLTPEDAYFTGTAADYDDPEAFKRAHLARTKKLVAAGQAPASYAQAVATADASHMWTLGRDAGARDFGSRYRDLTCPTLYLWSATTTPPATVEYLAHHQIPAHRLDAEHHWPWLVDAKVIAELVRRL
jgi:pimeloyl-ACP methyl ester carboxylesterase